MYSSNPTFKVFDCSKHRDNLRLAVKKIMCNSIYLYQTLSKDVHYPHIYDLAKVEADLLNCIPESTQLLECAFFEYAKLVGGFTPENDFKMLQLFGLSTGGLFWGCPRIAAMKKDTESEVYEFVFLIALYDMREKVNINKNVIYNNLSNFMVYTEDYLFQEDFYDNMIR